MGKPRLFEQTLRECLKVEIRDDNMIAESTAESAESAEQAAGLYEEQANTIDQIAYAADKLAYVADNLQEILKRYKV